LRSFDYVATASVIHGSPAKKAWSTWWSGLIGNTYLRSYLADIADSALIPDSSDGIDSLLDAFMVSKALREVHWELANRPDWVGIPVAGIRQLLDQDPPFSE